MGDLRGPRRTPGITHARKIAVWITQKVCQYAMVRIGSMYGGRDKTAIADMCREVDAMTGEEKRVAEMLLSDLGQSDRDHVPSITNAQLKELAKTGGAKDEESLRQTIEAGVNEIRKMRGAKPIEWPA